MRTWPNEGWASIEAEKTYELVARFGNQPPWTIEMTGFEWGNGLRGVRNVNDETEQVAPFVDEFMTELRMRWTIDGTEIGTYSLNGSYRAMQEVFACQESYEAATSGDPFAGSGVRDPFR